MISVTEAERLIRQHTPSSPETAMDIHNASKTVLREDLFADQNYPPFNRVAMDGIAINQKALDQGIREFKIEAIQKAGTPQLQLNNHNACIEVMTGSVLPRGCNLVISYENLNINSNFAIVSPDHLTQEYQNIHIEGSDYKRGDLLVAENCDMLAPHWAIAASIGRSKVKVSSIPKIAIVSTGDELVSIDSKPLAYQVRRSNASAILSSLNSAGISPSSIHHLNDDKNKAFDSLEKIISDNDIVILCGGVSKGKFDFVPQVLRDLQVNQIFHGVKQKPGKPMWFGVTADQKQIFGLPGNPFASLVCLHRYVLPAINNSLKNQKTKTTSLFASLEEKVIFNKNFSYFLPVYLKFSSDAKVFATPVYPNGSGDFASLVKSDGFIELEADKNLFPKGSIGPVFLWG